MTSQQGARTGTLLATFLVGLLVGALALAVAGAAPRPDSRSAGASPVPLATPPPDAEADVIVYGATASGVIAAVSAAREGASVILLSTDDTIGGMVTSGLSRTDVRLKHLVGGLTREFHARVGRFYGLDRHGQSDSWYHEPHVARLILHDMLTEAHVTVYRDARLAPEGVSREGGRIAGLTLEGESTVTGRLYIDATYEGDLLAAAGVGHRVGREATEEYGEPLAGVQVGSRPDVYGRYWTSGQVLPGVTDAAPQPNGTGDEKTQAFTYRLCVTNEASNRAPFPVPPSYDPRAYVLIQRSLEARAKDPTQPIQLKDLLKLAPIPGAKADMNNVGLFSTNLIGGSWGWAEASWEEREEIARRHWEWQAGLLEFLRTSEGVPADVRQELAQYGLCADEFTESANWPPLLYVRESRRMLGEYVMTQDDVQVDLRKEDSIGVGAYWIDSHYVERLLDADGGVVGEGQLHADVEPYDIPMRILLPRREESSNLLVTSALSASHVAFSTLRMEPQLMTLGEAAGVSARSRRGTHWTYRTSPMPAWRRSSASEAGFSRHHRRQGIWLGGGGTPVAAATVPGSSEVAPGSVMARPLGWRAP